MPPRVKLELLRLAAYVAAVALVAGLVRGGGHYLYCPFMGEVVAAHCCADQGGESPDGAVDSPDCCETESIGTLPSAQHGCVRAGMASSPVLAVIPPLARAGSGGLSLARRSARRAAGPEPPGPAARVARSMVSLR